MVMNVLEDHFGSVYTGHHMMEAVGPGQIVCADHLDYTAPYLRGPQFQILILYIFHALCHFATKNLCMHVRRYKALLFYIILWSEQKCVAGNIMKNSKVCCLIRVCSYFVIIMKVYIF
jgi:hypothetical protein